MASSINWPSTLPQFILEEGYTRNLRSNLVVTNMSTGPTKVRRRNTKRINDLQCTIALSQAQLVIFETFFLSDLGLGSLSFNFPNPEKPTEMIEVRFNVTENSYTITPEGGTTFFTVSFTLETV